MRAQRLALENPPTQTVEDTKVQDAVATEEQQENIMIENNESTPQPTIKEEQSASQAPGSEATDDKLPNEANDASEDTIPKVSDSSKGLQGPSPPSSNDIKVNLVGLGIDTSAATDDAAPGTAGPPDSSIDSLFEAPSSGGNHDNSNIDFSSMEFLDSTNTQGQNEFDLDNFGTSQDFNMADLHTANDSGQANNNSGNKQDDIFELINTSGGDDLMDIDLDLGAAGGDDPLDDMFYGLGDDGNTGGGGEMEHGYDNAFFGL